MNIFRKSVLSTTLAATAMVTASPAMARDHYRDNDNTAAVAIGAGIIGLAIGAIVAGSNDRDRYDDRYYNSRYHVRDGWYYRDGYYYNRSGQRYDRRDWHRRYGDRYDRRDQRRHDDRRYEGRRGYDNRYYERRGY